MWQPDRAISESRMVRFISSGYKRVSSEELWLAFSSIIEQVINRMRQQGVTKSPLTEEWERISAAQRGKGNFFKKITRVDIYPYAEGARFTDGIIRAASTLAEDILTDFLDVARPDAIEEEIDWVLSSTDISVEHSVDLTNGLPRVAHIEDATTYRQYPWRTGWRSASLLRAELGLEPSDSARTGDSVRRPSLSPWPIKGCRRSVMRMALRWGSSCCPGTWPEDRVGSPKTRAIWHLLDNPKGIFLVVASYGIRQKIERAFAAEFLAPAEGIRAIISDPSAVSWDEVREGCRQV